MNIEKMERLKRSICDELELMADKPLNGSSLDAIDKLAHAGKNVCKMIEMCDGGEYSGANWGYEPMIRGGYSRGINMGGSSYRRDSMGRYSRASGDVMTRLEDMMAEAKDERERSAIRSAIDMMR